ncbi:MAG: hypothetical protein Q8K77_08215, partial [Thermodesulfovibrionales bacterium]|nr:hypothetical protein [Thermodesulfovibrionales bacterium]
MLTSKIYKKSYHLQVILLTLFVIFPFISNATDLNKLYSSNYKVFWKQWNKSKEKAVICKDYVATASFLSNAVITLSNAEVSEANAEVIEALCLNKTK